MQFHRRFVHAVCCWHIVYEVTFQWAISFKICFIHDRNLSANPFVLIHQKPPQLIVNFIDHLVVLNFHAWNSKTKQFGQNKSWHCDNSCLFSTFFHLSTKKIVHAKTNEMALGKATIFAKRKRKISIYLYLHWGWILNHTINMLESSHLNRFFFLVEERFGSQATEVKLFQLISCFVHVFD